MRRATEPRTTSLRMSSSRCMPLRSERGRVWRVGPGHSDAQTRRAAGTMMQSGRCHAIHSKSSGLAVEERGLETAWTARGARRSLEEGLWVDAAQRFVKDGIALLVEAEASPRPVLEKGLAGLVHAELRIVVVVHLGGGRTPRQDNGECSGRLGGGKRSVCACV